MSSGGPVYPRVRVARRLKLPRTLGVGDLFSTCYGNVGSSIYYALGVTASVALGLTPLAFLLAGAIFVTTALNYAEGTAALPHAGGSSSFARRAFNQPIGFIVGWIQLLNYTATVSISAYAAVAYFSVFGKFAPVLLTLNKPFWHALGAVGLIALLVGINVVGIHESSKLNFLLAMLDLGTQLVLVVLGIWLLLNISVVIHNIHLGTAPTWGAFLASISIAMVSYTGIETISNMAEEARNPTRTIPRATHYVIVAVLMVSAVLPTIGMSVFPVFMDSHGGFVTDLALKWKDDPVAGIVTAFPGSLAHIAGVWVAVLAFTILVIATNAGLIGISRLSFSLAHSRLLPHHLATLHPRFRTPWVSIVVFGAFAAVLVLPARIELLAAVYSLAATFAFASAHLAVLRLRFVAPDLRRPYQMPLNIRVGRASLPLLSVIGALVIGAVFTDLISENIQNSSLIYLGWLVAGGAVFVAYRSFIRKPIWEPLEARPAAVPASPYELPHRRPEERVYVGRRVRAAEHHGPAPIRMPLPERRKKALTRRRQRPVGQTAFDLGRAGLVRRLRMAPIITTVGLIAVAAAAIAFNLSPLDPTGSRLSWSVGVVIVLVAAAFIILGQRPHTDHAENDLPDE